MKFTIEQFLLKQNINDDLFYSSLICELEEIIENELSKDTEEMNAELIDDCCVAIENLLNTLNGREIQKYEAVLGVERIIKQHRRKLRSIYVAAVACAAVAVLCAVTSIKLTNKNVQTSLKPNSAADNNLSTNEHTVSKPVTAEKEQVTRVENTEPTTSLSNETTAEVSQVTENQITEEIAPPSTMPIPHIYNLEVIIPPGAILEFEDESKINLDNFFVRVYYSGNNEKVVSIDECDVDIGTPDENGRTKITITYNHMYTSIYVNVGL